MTGDYITSVHWPPCTGTWAWWHKGKTGQARLVQGVGEGARKWTRAGMGGPMGRPVQKGGWRQDPAGATPSSPIWAAVH